MLFISDESMGDFHSQPIRVDALQHSIEVCWCFRLALEELGAFIPLMDLIKCQLFCH